MTIQQDNQLKKQFIKHFLWSAYTNMEMENETHETYNEKKLYERYKSTIDALINEWVYKKLQFAHEW